MTAGSNGVGLEQVWVWSGCEWIRAAIMVSFVRRLDCLKVIIFLKFVFSENLC